jgi:hypothetical protein
MRFFRKRESAPTSAVVWCAAIADRVTLQSRRVSKRVIARAGTNAEPLGDRAMNHFRDCHREERSDVAIQLIDCSGGLPQSPRLLRNDKQGEFIYTAGTNAT